MKYVFTGMLLLMGSSLGYADNPCANSNPYLQQTCEKLNQSATAVQKTRDEQLQKETAQNKELVQKNIEEANKKPEPPAPSVPEWQKSLMPTPAQKTPIKPANPETTSTEARSTVKPLPPLEPTQFATPKAVTLPGGVNVIPVTPPKNQGTIKYY